MRRHDQRGLGEAISRQKGLFAEPAAGETRCEAFQGIRPDAFGSAWSCLPAGKIQSGKLVVADGSQAGLESEVRTTAHRRPMAADRGQPAQRTPYELIRAHPEQWNSRLKGIEKFQHQAHVMIGWQPAQNRSDFKIPVDRERPVVSPQIRMTDHHSLGRSSGTRCVLQQTRQVRIAAITLNSLRLREPPGGDGLKSPMHRHVFTADHH